MANGATRSDGYSMDHLDRTLMGNGLIGTRQFI